MAITLQILHASDFEADILAIDDSIGFSAILEGFRTNDVADQVCQQGGTEFLLQEVTRAIYLGWYFWRMQGTW